MNKYRISYLEHQCLFIDEGIVQGTIPESAKKMLDYIKDKNVNLKSLTFEPIDDIIIKERINELFS